MRARQIAVLTNFALLLIAGASVVSAAYILTLGNVLIQLNIIEAATGDLVTQIPLEIVAGQSGTKNVNGGTFTLNRECNVTVSVSSNATIQQFDSFNLTVKVQSAGDTYTLDFDLLVGQSSDTIYDLPEQEWTVTYTVTYVSLGTSASACEIYAKWIVE